MSALIIKQINTLVQENRFEEARAIIDRLASEQASDPAILCQLGKLVFLMGDLSEAKNHLQASIALDPANFETHFQLGLILLKEGKPEQAMPAFREACELKPDFALGHFYWGLTVYEKGNLRGALGQFKAAYKADNSLFTALYYAGLTNQRLDKNEDALNDLQEVIVKEPDFAPAYNALGVTFLALGKTDQAVSAFERAVKLRPDFALAHFYLATVLSGLNQYDQAHLHYREALNSPDLSAQRRGLIYNNLAVSLVQAGQWEAASEYLLQAKNIAPHIVDVQMNFGLAQIALQEYDLAVSSFQQILHDFPDYYEASLYNGIALLGLRRYKDSEKSLSNAQSILAKSASPQPTATQAMLAQAPLSKDQIDNLNSRMLLWLGYGYLAGQNYGTAKEQFEKIISRGKKTDKKLLSLAQDALGLAYSLDAHYREAINHFNQSLELDPDFALAYLHRARSSEALQDAESAHNDYARAIELDPDCLKEDKDLIAQLLQSANIEEALSHTIKVLTYIPQDVETQILMAKALKEKKDYPDALALLSSIMVQEPENAEAYTILGQIHMEQGNFARADEVFQAGSGLDNVEAELFLDWSKH